MSEALNSEGAYLVLNAIPNIGPITTNRLLQNFDGDPLRIFTASARELESVNGVGPVISKTVREWQSHFDLEKEQDKLAKTGV
ncbi:MAG TPA: helix-hairpin-helix domain-containing protein, partial [Opitutaceae bacterium]|nr:helix-hairpin-helix domain-containing protein [Opitutaceae bacterium]